MNFKSFFAPYYTLSSEEKRNLIFLSFTYFLTLFTYPIIRSSSDAFLIQMYGAKNWPWANVLSIIVLMICVTIYNKLQVKYGMKKLFYATSLISAVFFGLSAYFYAIGFKPWAFAFFVCKEAYIVILVHMCLGFFNTHFSYEFAKSFFGPFGGFTSIGSITGGLVTSYLAKEVGMTYLILIGAAVLLLIPFLVKQLNEDSGRITKKKSNKSPLSTLDGIWNYVIFIILLVASSQILINIFNFKFNFFIQDNMATALDKTVFFGKIYTLINIGTLIIQFVLTPLALRSLSLRSNHYIVAGMYGFALIPIMIFGGAALTLVSGVFILSKAMDYSFFGTIKEMLYYPLDEYQKYGAKYVTDMVMYRASKLVVSLFLGFVQSFKILNTLMIVVGVAWIGLVYALFRMQKTLKKQEI